MNKGRIVSGMAILLLFTSQTVHAEWRIVKKYIQKDVIIKEETREHLVLYHKDLEDSIILSMEVNQTCDIYSKMNHRRGSNPYLIWVASDHFYNDPKLPRKTWSRFLRAEFLRNLRPPMKDTFKLRVKEALEGTSAIDRNND